MGGDALTRFVICVPIKKETAAIVAKALFAHWISVFGVPEKLLSDNGKQMASEIIQALCHHLGMKKVATTPHHPQSDGRIERHNKVICDVLQRELVEESNWAELLPLVTFQYNATEHRAIKTTPYKAMFGSDPFDYDQGMLLQYYIDQEADQEPLSERLKQMHHELFTKSLLDKKGNAQYYNQAAKEKEFEVGERVMVFNTLGLVEEGRKLRAPWLGPYEIISKFSDLGYELKGVVNNSIARAHVNRLRRANTEAIESSDPKAGMYPDSHRLLRSIQDSRKIDGKREYLLPNVGRKGSRWEKEMNLPEVVVAAYDLLSGKTKKRQGQKKLKKASATQETEATVEFSE